MPVYVITENTTQQNGPPGTVYTGADVDNYFWEVIPTANYGSNTSFNVNKFGAGDHEHAVLRITNLGVIPASETIDDAKLWLRQSSASSTYSIDVRSLLVSFTEGGSNWNTRDGTTSWNTGGALGAGTDRTSVPESTTSVASTLQYYSFDVTSLVSDWHTGVLTNNGVHLERSDSGEDSTIKTFISSEGTDGQRPEWVIQTSVASGGPTIPVLLNHYRNQGML